MTFLKAAESVLKETRRPMRPEEIVKLAIEKGWLSSGGKTPEATMSAALGVHIKKGGKVFVRAMPGFYGLGGRGRATAGEVAVADRDVRESLELRIMNVELKEKEI